MNPKKISVCIATFNGEQYISEQIHSILCQLRDQDEIIISDDSSSDKTVRILREINDPRIVILENNTFFSPVYNFENALIHASGDIIFLADQDDLWKSDKVTIVLEYLKDADVVLSDCEIINQKGERLYPSFFEYNDSRSGFVNNLLKNSYIGCCMAFNRTVLDKALPFPREIAMHDWWIGLIGEACGKTVFLPKPLIAYRRHGENLSDSGGKSRYGTFKKIGFRLILLKNLLKRCYSNA